MKGYDLTSKLDDAFRVKGLAGKQVTVLRGPLKYKITYIAWCDDCDEFHLDTESDSFCSEGITH